MWEELYEDHYKELVAYGTSMSGNKELAEDLAQEAFVRALMNTETVEDLSPGKRRAWLFRTFKNLFFDRYRRAVLEKNMSRTGSPSTWRITEYKKLKMLCCFGASNPRIGPSFSCDTSTATPLKKYLR